MSPSLSALSVSATGETLYRHILRNRPATLAHHAAELGLAESVAHRELQGLINMRLVRETADGIVLAEPPDAALDRLIDSEESSLVSRRAHLNEVRGSIKQFTADFQLGQLGSATPGTPGLERVSRPTLMTLMADAMVHTTGLVRCSIAEQVVRVDDEVARTSREVISAGRPQRTLFAPTALPDPADVEMAQAWAAYDDEQRVGIEPLTDFIIFGADLVLSSPTWQPTLDGALAIRDPVLVRVFTALFDHAWSVALPLRDVTQPSPERLLVSLLATGMKDETIARNLGWGVRTVRRRVARLMADLGVTTRFQLGVAAERSGLLTVTDR